MKRFAIEILVGLFLITVINAVSVAAGTAQTDFEKFLKEYEAKAIPLSKESALWGFRASVSGNDSDYQKSAEASYASGKIYTDKAAFEDLKKWHESGEVTDPLLKRQLKILYLSYLGTQIDTSMLKELIKRQTAISQKFYTYRVKLNGQTLSDNQVDSILKNSTNSAELEATWKASKEIGRVIAPELIELIKLRNKAAKTLGFANYYEMQMKLGEQEPSEIAALFDQLDSLTGRAFDSLKREMDSTLAIRYNVPKNQLKPWHYQNRFFQEAPSIYGVNLDAFYAGKDPVAIVKKYYASIGLPVDSILSRSDLYERPGKYQHAYETDIDRLGDVRIVCNVRPDAEWTGTLLHELGHGVYDYYNDRNLPWLLRSPAHSFTTEAIANFFQHQAGNPDWIKDFTGAPEEDIDKVADDCEKMQRLGALVFCRWTQVMVRFERALYENPDQDLNKLWWDLVEKYQGLVRPEGRNEPDWASKIHIADAPVYYHNYMIAELLASQIAATIGGKVLGLSDPYNSDFADNARIGEFLKEKIFYPGSRYTWNEMIERATGEKLTSVYYARQFIGGK